MFYKENQEALFKEKFHSLDISTTTPDDLINILEDGKVILSIEIYDNNKCQVRSYALVDGEIMVYAPYHVLAADSATFKIEAFNEWREKFTAEDTYLDIENEFYEPHGNDKHLLHKGFTDKNQLYTSSDKSNFPGQLECNFMELWLSINKDYYI